MKENELKENELKKVSGGTVYPSPKITAACMGDADHRKDEYEAVILSAENGKEN